jgi:starvation-inducible DNA-binding protein
MTQMTSPLPDQARKVTGEALQEALVDLIGLGLLGKQAHWTIVGPRFRPLHMQLDEIVETARENADLVAERAAAIGYPPDGRPQMLAESTALPQYPTGWRDDREVVETFVHLHAGIIERMRHRIAATERTDPVSQSLLIDLTAQLEKHAWMLQAEN